MLAYETYRTTRDTARARANAARQALEAQVNLARKAIRRSRVRRRMSRRRRPKSGQHGKRWRTPSFALPSRDLLARVRSRSANTFHRRRLLPRSFVQIRSRSRSRLLRPMSRRLSLAVEFRSRSMHTGPEFCGFVTAVNPPSTPRHVRRSSRHRSRTPTMHFVPACSARAELRKKVRRYRYFCSEIRGL